MVPVITPINTYRFIVFALSSARCLADEDGTIILRNVCSKDDLPTHHLNSILSFISVFVCKRLKPAPEPMNVVT